MTHRIQRALEITDQGPADHRRQLRARASGQTAGPTQQQDPAHFARPQKTRSTTCEARRAAFAQACINSEACPGP